MQLHSRLSFSTLDVAQPQPTTAQTDAILSFEDIQKCFNVAICDVNRSESAKYSDNVNVDVVL